MQSELLTETTVLDGVFATNHAGLHAELMRANTILFDLRQALYVQSDAPVDYGMDAVAGIEDRRFATADDAVRGFAQLATDRATLANSREPLASAWRQR